MDPDPAHTEADGATVVRHLRLVEPGLVAEYTLTADGTGRVVELTDYLPGNWALDGYGFHPEYAPRGGSTGEDAIEMTVAVEPSASTVIVYGLSTTDPVSTADLDHAQEFSPPQIRSVSRLVGDSSGAGQLSGPGFPDAVEFDDPAALFEAYRTSTHR